MAEAVYFFCVDPDRDPVAAGVLQAVRERLSPGESAAVVDRRPVLVHRDAAGNRFHFVATDKVISHDYPRYLPTMREHFAGCDFAAVVNWHEGANAPDHILCAHTTGDVVSGHYGPADPRTFRNLLRALEEDRREAGLDDYRVTSEATHWSGIPYDGDPATIAEFPVPLVDLEIGSSPQCWSDPAARGVLAAVLPRVFDGAAPAASLLCVGGVHFQETYGTAVLASPPDGGVAVSHILANQWVTDEEAGYERPEGLEKLRACVASIAGGVDGIVYHDNLKGPYKQNLRLLAEELEVSAFKHKKLRKLDKIPF